MSTILTDDELPPLRPHDHPEPHTMQWSQAEMRAIRAYARAVEAAVLAKLAQQEPVAWLARRPNGDSCAFEADDPDLELARTDPTAIFHPLYTHPATQQADRQRVPEIDYEALIHAAYAKNRRWAQGTNGCVAFKEGAEWFRAQMLATPPEAPVRASAVDEREAFEAWAIDQPYIAAKNLWDERSRYGEEEYESHEVQLMWEAWKARAALAQKGGAA